MTPTWPLLRLYAYSVAPGAVIEGGAVATTRDMQDALLEAHNKARLDHALPVTFVVNTATRTSDMRNRLLDLGFGSAADAGRAVNAIAGRLANAMDGRSKPCLLVMSTRGDKASDIRYVAIWTFPKDEAFRLSTKSDRVDLLDDVFSRSSNLRKAAVFEGRNTKTQFLTGRVLDYQANVSDRFVADYWVDRFLGAQLQVSGEEGTTFLARTLRAANEALVEDPAAQAQLHAAIAAVRQSPTKRWSLEDFSRNYLSGDAAAAFAAAAPNPDAMRSVFDFDLARFDALIQFRLYRLDTGVFVSAPFSEIGQSVTVDDDKDARVLSVRGRVVDEKIRARGR